MCDAGRGVGGVLVERLVLEERLGEVVELVTVFPKERQDLLVRVRPRRGAPRRR